MKPDYYGFILVHVKAEQQFKPEGNMFFKVKIKVQKKNV